MILGKEREAVRNATRAIRDLVLRPGRELALGSGLGGGLGAMALLVAAPLRHLPEIAARMPGTLRDLGERVTAIPGARRRAPALAFAARALAGSVRNGSALRERYLNLLAATMDEETSARVHPAFLGILRELTADEVRLVSQFQHDGPFPLLSVVARYRFGGPLSTELRHLEPARHRRPAARTPSGCRSTSTTSAGWASPRSGRSASPTTPAASARSRRARRSRPPSRACRPTRRRRSRRAPKTTTIAWWPTSSARPCT